MDRNRFLKFAGLAATLVAPAYSNAQLAAAERRSLEDALYLANITPNDLAFARRPAGGQKQITILAMLESNPLGGVDNLLSVHETPGVELHQLLRLVHAEALNPTVRKSGDFDPSEIQPDPQTPEAYRDVLLALARGVAKSSSTVRAALSKLSIDERRDLIESLPQLATRDSKPRFDFVDRKPLNEADCLPLLAKVDWNRMSQAASELVEAYEDNVTRLAAIAKGSPITGDFKLNFGRFVIVFGGIGPNVHSDRDATLTIDLGGNDRYSGRHGAGIGYSAMLIDLAGDDFYEVPDASVGAGILGCGLASDLGGDDVFRTRSVALGAGIGGYGFFRKFGGHDVYQTANLSCGFGMFGVGVSVDTAGSDIYQCHTTSQGSANANGVGWMLDLAGNDTYRSATNGTRVPTFCQGASSGFIDQRIGGCGLLTDRDGTDAYISVSHSQGAGASGGAGSLSDAKGNDSYVVAERGQGWGESNGSGLVFESGGDDGFLATNGLSHAQAQGYGFSFLLERSGNDIFVGHESRPGTAHSGSLSLFYDLAGNDRYAGPPGRGIPTAQSHAMGIFIDLVGEDAYFEGLDNSSATTMLGNGLAFDQESMRIAAERNDVQNSPVPGSIPLPGAQELQNLVRTAMEAEIDALRREAVHKLIGIGMPAFESVLNDYLERADSVERTVILDLAIGIGPDARSMLAFQITKESDPLALNALLICEAGRFKEAGAAMIGALKRPALLQSAARAAGAFGERACVTELMVAAADKDPMTSAYALMSLAALGDPASATTGQALLASPDLMVRSAARTLVAKFPEAAIQIARGMTRDPNERLARIGIELLGAVGTPEAMKVAAESLTDVRSGVRIAALSAVNGRCPADKRGHLMSLKRDPDHRVRAVAARIDPGRS